jgi:hypothetical protein
MCMRVLFMHIYMHAFMRVYNCKHGLRHYAYIYILTHTRARVAQEWKRHKAQTTVYDCLSVESAMFHFNTVTRTKHYTHNCDSSEVGGVQCAAYFVIVCLVAVYTVLILPLYYHTFCSPHF